MHDQWSRPLAPELVRLAALGREPSITRAARASGTTQPTLSRSIRRWERELGVSLVAPDGHGVRLTAEGLTLVGAADEAVRLIDRAGRRIAGAGSPLTIGFLRSLGPTVVSELVTSFLAVDPEARIAHRELSTPELLDELEVGRIDIGVAAPRPPDRYRWLRLGRQAIVVAVPRTHRFAQREALDVAELRGERLLGLDRRFDARRVADVLGARAGLDHEVSVEADDFMTVTNYVAAGLGVAILPADPGSGDRVATVPITDPAAQREFGLIWRGERATTQVDALVAHARGLGDRYPGWADIQP